MKLKESNVLFNSVEHTYLLDGKILKGITGILSRHLFEKKYDAVPEEVLRSSAEKGKAIHSEIEMSENGFAPATPSEEFLAYFKLKEKKGFKVERTEYIVTDNENYASPIDLVLSIDGKLCLCDIKTTSVLDSEYLMWQLSIYKYLFELQNGVKVDLLAGIHLRGDKAKYEEVKCIDDGIIKELLLCDIRGDKFKNPFKTISVSEDELLQRVYDIEQQLVIWETEVKASKELQSQYKEELMRIMDVKGVKSLETDKLKITRKADSVRVSLDSKLIKEEMPDVYEKYAKESQVKGSIILTIK